MRYAMVMTDEIDLGWRWLHNDERWVKAIIKQETYITKIGSANKNMNHTETRQWVHIVDLWKNIVRISVVEFWNILIVWRAHEHWSHHVVDCWRGFWHWRIKRVHHQHFSHTHGRSTTAVLLVIFLIHDLIMTCWAWASFMQWPTIHDIAQWYACAWSYYLRASPHIKHTW